MNNPNKLKNFHKISWRREKSGRKYKSAQFLTNTGSFCPKKVVVFEKGSCYSYFKKNNVFCKADAQGEVVVIVVIVVFSETFFYIYTFALYTCVCENTTTLTITTTCALFMGVTVYIIYDYIITIITIITTLSTLIC